MTLTPVFSGMALTATSLVIWSAPHTNSRWIAGSTKRICTDISRATSGRLFPKVGAEAVYAVGLAGGDRAIAVKIDDGGLRALHAVVIALLERFGFATEAELFALETWRGTPIRNWAGTEVGRLEVTA